MVLLDCCNVITVDQPEHEVFKSAVETYFKKLLNAKSEKFNSTIVPTKEEFIEMMQDVSVRAPMTIHTVRLPKGMTMHDERLRTGQFKAVSRTFDTLAPGEFPDLMLKQVTIADLETKLVPDNWVPEHHKEKELRAQVIDPRLLDTAKINGTIMRNLGYPDTLLGNEDYKILAEAARVEPVRPVAAAVEMACKELSDVIVENKNRGFFNPTYVRHGTQ